MLKKGLALKVLLCENTHPRDHLSCGIFRRPALVFRPPRGCDPFRGITMRSLCLLLKPFMGTYFRVLRDFKKVVCRKKSEFYQKVRLVYTLIRRTKRRYYTVVINVNSKSFRPIEGPNHRVSGPHA